jgi:hypothetical protein
MTAAALGVERARLFKRLRIEREHAVERVACGVELGDAVQIGLHQLF